MPPTSRASQNRIQQLQKLLHPDYRVESEIGGGGMAKVYLAVDTETGGKFAVKVLDEELATDPKIVARFVSEAQIQSQLSHPNIIRVFRIEQREDLHYYFMPFVEGEDLDTRIRQRRIGVREALKISVAIASALQCAHEANLVHRDLKPSNTRVDRWGTVMVMDFGIAQVRATAFLDGPAALNRSYPGQELGTPLYMSPEQWNGGAVDNRADLYSLGVILYEMLVGSNPFAGNTREETRKLHLEYVPPPASKVVAGIEPEVSRIAERLLEKNPKSRFQSAAELVRILNDLLDNTGLTPKPGVHRKTQSLARPLDAIPHLLLDQTVNRELTPNEQHVRKFMDGVRTVQEILQVSGLQIDEAERAFGSLRKDSIWMDIPLRTP